MKESELPNEALAAISRVRQLEASIESATSEFARNVEEMRARVDLMKAEVQVDRDALARERSDFELMVADKVAAAGLLADLWADYESVRAETIAEKLRLKGRPAKSAAVEVAAEGRQAAELARLWKANEWVLRLYEFHFPWLEDLRGEEERSYLTGERAPASSDANDDERSADPASGWLSREEYLALPETERNQRALDRYLHSRKTPWQLGRDYERFIGYLREQDGWNVHYQGIFEGLEDLGRDLICTRGEEMEVIQCKRWAQHKVIREKHIFQLFGTVVAARIENPTKVVTGTFVTTTGLSDRAHAFAEQLEIRVEEQFPLGDYPRIKCNVAPATGERIYHLPFDQQYDRAQIGPIEGEVWVGTVAEAEALGFRRAWRWRGSGAT